MAIWRDALAVAEVHDKICGVSNYSSRMNAVDWAAAMEGYSTFSPARSPFERQPSMRAWNAIGPGA